MGETTMTRALFGAANSSETIRQIEASLLDQGIKLFPPTRSGESARYLWLQIKPYLLRGAPVDISISALNLDWHREELKRAKTILIEMELIKRRDDGRYVLGQLGPFSKIDELIRDQYFFLKLAEAVVLALGTILPKSKTQKTTRHAPGHRGPAPSKLPSSHGVQSEQSAQSARRRNHRRMIND